MPPILMEKQLKEKREQGSLHPKEVHTPKEDESWGQRKSSTEVTSAGLMLYWTTHSLIYLRGDNLFTFKK